MFYLNYIHSDSMSQISINYVISIMSYQLVNIKTVRLSDSNIFY